MADALIARAQQAEAQADWLQAGMLWEEAIRQDPKRTVSYLGAAAAAQKLNAFDKAEAILLEGHRLFPWELRFLADYARLAEAQRNWEEAADRWAKAREAFPDATFCYG